MGLVSDEALQGCVGQVTEPRAVQIGHGHGRGRRARAIDASCTGTQARTGVEATRNEGSSYGTWSIDRNASSRALIITVADGNRSSGFLISAPSISATSCGVHHGCSFANMSSRGAGDFTCIRICIIGSVFL